MHRVRRPAPSTTAATRCSPAQAQRRSGGPASAAAQRCGGHAQVGVVGVVGVVGGRGGGRGVQRRLACGRALELELHRRLLQHVHAAPHGAQPAEALRQLRAAVVAREVGRRAELAERAQVRADRAHAVGGGGPRVARGDGVRQLQEGVERHVAQRRREALALQEVGEGALELGRRLDGRVGCGERLEGERGVGGELRLQREARLEELHQVPLVRQRDRGGLEDVGLAARHALQLARRATQVRLHRLELEVRRHARGPQHAHHLARAQEQLRREVNVVPVRLRQHARGRRALCRRLGRHEAHAGGCVRAHGDARLRWLRRGARGGCGGMVVVRWRAQPRVHLLEAEAAAPRAVVVVAVQVQHPPTGAGAGGGEQALREAGAHDDHVELLGELGGLHFFWAACFRGVWRG